MNTCYIILITITALAPVLVSIVSVMSRSSSNGTIIEEQMFEDYMFRFETKFIQAIYNDRTTTQSFSPQSAFIMLLLLGYGSSGNIRDKLHTGMDLKTTSFDELRTRKGNLRAVAEILHHRYVGMRQVLGWSWKMENNIDEDCIEQDSFVEVLELFNSTITKISDDKHSRRIQTITTESFEPLFHWFRVTCFMISTAKGPKKVSIIVNNARVGQLSNIENVEFYELVYRKTNQNVSIIFLNPDGTQHLESMMEKFGEVQHTDFMNDTNELKRINLTMPLGNWTVQTGSSEFRPFFTEILPSYTRTQNTIKGNFEKICALDNPRNQLYQIMGEVNMNFRLGWNQPPRIPMCDEKQERRKKSSTSSVVLTYPFVVMIMVDKSIVYFSVIHGRKE